MSDPDGEQGLEEVERALSVLGGRHPGKVRAEREAAEATARRQREHEARAAAARRRARIGWVIGGVVAFVVGICGWQALRIRSAQRAVDDEVAQLERPYLAMGFIPITHGTFASQHRLELQTTPGGCYVIVATHEAQLRIERPTGVAGAQGAAFMCACGSEDVVATVPVGAAVRAVFMPGATFGGIRAMPYHFDSARSPTLIAGGEACADEAVESFARDHHYAAQAADRAWLDAHPTLASAGFVVAASAQAALPFIFIDATPNAPSRCFIAASTEPADALTLWVLPGQKPLQSKQGTIGWCDAKGAAFIVERGANVDAKAKTAGALAVLVVPSRRIGGALGLHEQLAAAGIANPNVWLSDDERGTLAADALRASVVPDPVAVVGQAIDGSQAEAARVLAFSVGGTGSFVPDALGSAAFECAPPLSDHTRETVCVQTHGQSWRPPPAEVPSGAAFGSLPFWMSALQGVEDPARTHVELLLVGLARKLAARGFAPTIIEGVTEKAGSVEVLGRSGEDAVVAVGLWPSPPYARPYTDGPAWSLDGEPRVVPLKGGARVTMPLTAETPLPLDKRRTVVFRHAI